MSASDRTLRLLRALFDVDPAVAARAMATGTVALTMPEPSAPDELALALCAIELLRLDEAAPEIVIDAPTSRARALPGLSDAALVDALASAHVGFESVDRLRHGATDDADLVLSFGRPGRGRFVASRGWAALVDVEADGPPGNELGAAFSGILAAIEAFKVLLIRAGVPASRVPRWQGAVSMWDYSLFPAPGPSMPSLVDLSGHAFVGAGGIATGCGWVLGTIAVAGDPLIVDFDGLDETSLNRHLSGGFANIGDGKARLLGDLFAGAACAPRPRECRWQDQPAADRSPVVAVVSVDDDRTRRDVQLDMPRWLLNAGTSDDGLYRLTSHDFEHAACARCVSRADLRYPSLLESIAARLGVAASDIAPFSRSRDPLPPSLIARFNVDPSVRELLATVPGRDFLEIACGHLRVAAPEPAVSAPMLSAAPGVLLAASIVKGSIGAPDPPGLDLRTSVLSGPHARWSRTLAKRSDCECSDPLYVEHYRRKWSSPQSPR